MAERDEQEAPTEITHLEDWARTLAEESLVAPISQETVAKALEALGANFEIGESQRESLSKYTEGGKIKGLRAVWGGEYEDYLKFVGIYVKRYEATQGKVLPALRPSGRKNSGMIQFFGEITAYAAGAMSFEDLKLYLEARAKNGRAWAEGRKEDRVRIKVPTKDEPILLSSFPPEFPPTALGFLIDLAQ